MVDTATRDKICTWLKSRRPYLSELYQGATVLVDAKAPPGYARFVAHAAREILLGLQDITGRGSGGRVDDKAAARALIEELFRVQDSIAEPMVGAASPTVSAAPTVAVPLELYRRLKSFAEAHRTISANIQQKLTVMLQTIMSINASAAHQIAPTVNRLKKLYDDFTQRCHNRDQTDEQLFDEAFRADFSHFEEALATFAKSFVQSVEAIDEILDQANA